MVIRPLDKADQLQPIDPPIGSYNDYIHHGCLLLLSPKANTQFTIPQSINQSINQSIEVALVAQRLQG